MADKTEKNTTVEKKYSVPAVVNAFEILKVLSRKKYKESTLTEIANAVGLTPATCYRLLQQLKELSLVRYDNTKKRYTLGTYLVVLGERAKENLDFIKISEPYLEEVTRRTGLTSLLVSRVDDMRLTQIAKHEGENYGINISIGRHFNIFDGDSYGKCFLAFMEEAERKELIDRVLDDEAEKAALEEELATYRELGFVIRYSSGEKNRFPGIFGISCPIFLEPGNLELCLSVVGMTAQFSEEEVREVIAPQLKQVADRLNEEFYDED